MSTASDPALPPASTLRHFHVLAKPTGAICNLDCKYTLPAYCRRCEVKFACHGECPKNRFVATPDGEPGLNYLCAGYKSFFTHVDRPMRLMADLLRRQRYADEVMALLAAEKAAPLQTMFGATGRNEPCPCGSGRKFKRCHGGQRASTAVEHIHGAAQS